MDGKSTKRIGLLIERSRAFGRELCEGIISYAQERDDWEIVFLNVTDVRSQRKRSAIDGFIARVTSEELARHLKATKRPVVDVYYDFAQKGFAVVKTKHEKIGVLAAEHFLDRHFRNFAYCPYGGGRTSRYCQLSFARRLRREGLKCAVYDGRGIGRYEFDDAAVIAETIGLPRDAKSLEKWLRSLPKPVAVFCPGDLRAWQLINVCRRAGIEVPREVAVLGLDNDMILCGSSQPMLSSIDSDTQRIGRVAAETLAAMMDGTAPKGQIVRQVDPAGIVARKSTETIPDAPPWLSDALVFIRRNAKNGISAADVFRTLGRSHTVVTRAFRSTLGTTVQHAIADARLDEARRLLLGTDASIKQVAALSGFASVSYMLQAFTAKYGVSPGAWRRQQLSRSQGSRRDAP
ncbi:MAG: DNA-binding transcriptional regulator [Kiritimatiellae bacterium]|nr:DNA-binding transcriptional regulator [Kiritimatiellia bacterium]